MSRVKQFERHEADGSNSGERERASNPTQAGCTVDTNCISYPEVPTEASFPVECLPEAAQQMIAEVTRVSFAPQKLVAVQALAWMAASLGKGVVSKTGETKTFPNLFVLGISGTGTGKSESARSLGKPFQTFEGDKIKEWNLGTRPKIETRLKEIGLRLKYLDKAAGEVDGYGGDRAEVEKLTREQEELKGRKSPKLIVEDSTQEALTDAYNSHDGSLLSYSTDAGKVISNLLGRYAANTAGNTLREDTAFLKGYSVEGFSVERVNRSSVVSEPCLTLLWMIQPGKTETLYGDGALCDGGFLPRLMPCLTEEGLPQRTFQDGIDGGVSVAWHNFLNSFLHLRSQGGSPGDPLRIFFEIAEDAQNHWLQWDNGNRAKTKDGDLRDISAFVSRWGEWAQRIAVTLQAALYLKSKTPQITLETMKAAIRIAEWFAGEQLRILHKARVKAVEDERAKLQERAEKLALIVGANNNEKSLNDLKRSNGFTEKELRELCEKFPDNFEIRTKPTSTKPSVVCVLK
jgi:hypothetical protein